MRLLITDLDNTLYDWVTYFATSFEAMVKALATTLSIDEETLLDEFKVVHQRYGNSEHPFAVLELPSVHAKVGKVSKAELLCALEVPLRAFNSTCDEHLRLYPKVHETLSTLRDFGVPVVGHTEAIAVNAYYRLRKLGVINLFRRIYALEGHLEPHPNPQRNSNQPPPSELIRIVPRSERKPNPALLLDICKREGVKPADTWYVGDSLTRDIGMAKAAGITAVWAHYGLHYDPKLWDILVRVTHWTDEDVKREAELRAKYNEVQPDHTIDNFSDILHISGLVNADAQIMTGWQK